MTLLIVEDSKPLRAGISQILSAHRVIEADSVGEARDILKNTSVDAILLDLHLPKDSPTWQGTSKLIPEFRQSAAVIFVTIALEWGRTDSW
jgi:DNA-binding response OmpR family regulator